VAEYVLSVGIGQVSFRKKENMFSIPERLGLDMAIHPETGARMGTLRNTSAIGTIIWYVL
jgi:hypothetical protein